MINIETEVEIQKREIKKSNFKWLRLNFSTMLQFLMVCIFVGIGVFSSSLKLQNDLLMGSTVDQGGSAEIQSLELKEKAMNEVPVQVEATAGERSMENASESQEAEDVKKRGSLPPAESVVTLTEDSANEQSVITESTQSEQILGVESEPESKRKEKNRVNEDQSGKGRISPISKGNKESKLLKFSDGPSVIGEVYDSKTLTSEHSVTTEQAVVQPLPAFESDGEEDIEHPKEKQSDSVTSEASVLAENVKTEFLFAPESDIEENPGDSKEKDLDDAKRKKDPETLILEASELTQQLYSSLFNEASEGIATDEQNGTENIVADVLSDEKSDPSILNEEFKSESTMDQSDTKEVDRTYVEEKNKIDMDAIMQSQDVQQAQSIPANFPKPQNQTTVDSTPQTQQEQKSIFEVKENSEAEESEKESLNDPLEIKSTLELEKKAEAAEPEKEPLNDPFKVKCSIGSNEDAPSCSTSLGQKIEAESIKPMNSEKGQNLSLSNSGKDFSSTAPKIISSTGSTLQNASETVDNENLTRDARWYAYEQQFVGEWQVAKFWVEQILRYVPVPVRQKGAQVILQWSDVKEQAFLHLTQSFENTSLGEKVKTWARQQKVQYNCEDFLFHLSCGLFMSFLVAAAFKSKCRTKTVEGSREESAVLSKLANGDSIYNLENLGDVVTSLKKRNQHKFVTPDKRLDTSYISSSRSKRFDRSSKRNRLTDSNIRRHSMSIDDNYSEYGSSGRSSDMVTDYAASEDKDAWCGSDRSNILGSAAVGLDNVVMRSVREPRILVGHTVDVAGYGRGVIVDMTKKRKFVRRTYKIRFDDGKTEDLSLKRSSNRGIVPFQIINQKDEI